ncbi:MAG: ribosome silencing factor [Clostridia bacterium]|nr:ribosome silencing factor [Clostridia bacterium]MDD4571932.1 ribosome silencing factor [Clostridia bacterium]
MTNTNQNTKIHEDEILKNCVAFAFEKKAIDLVSIDLRGISPVADYFLICNGNNAPQVKAICDNIDEKMESELGIRPLRVEGYRDARWILMDYGTLIVHIFQGEEREFYSLERLWGDAPAYKYEPKNE